MKKTLLVLTFLAVSTLLMGASCSTTEIDSDTATTSETGKLVLQLTDEPALDVTKAEVVISQVQVHQTDADDDTGWITIVEEAQSFDLVAIKDVTVFLGEKQLAPGKYTQIRLDVDSATATIDGEVHELTIPSQSVKLVSGFQIKEGLTTTLTLDFDAQKSIKEAGQSGKYQMNPTIKVLAED